MSTTISHASFFDILPNGSHFRSDKPESRPATNIQSSGSQTHISLDDSGQKRGPGPSDGKTWPSEIKMDLPASVDGSPSSTVEEPPPDPDVTDDGSHQALDTVRSRSSSSSSDSSYSSISCGDTFEARNRRFPPLPPSTNRPARLFAAPRFGAQIASRANRRLAPDLSAVDSDSGPGDSSASESSEDGEEVSGGGEEDEEEGGNEDGDEDEDSHVQALWVKLRDQRNAVQQLRLELSDKRKRLRELRRRKDEADNRFMGDIIIRQFEVMQKERNEYHDEEAEVEQLEAELDEEELSREILETEFFTILYGASGGGGNHREDSPSGSVADSYAPPSRASLLGIPADRPDDIHPLYKQLLDAVGDRELAKENHADLMMHRDSILYNIQLTIKRERLRNTEGRANKLSAMPDTDDLELLSSIADNPARLDDLQAKYRTGIGRENEEFLREFPQEEAMLREKLKETKEEVDRLRQLCIDKGVMRKNAPYHEEYTIMYGTGEPLPAGTMSINPEPGTRREEGLANTRFPILLSNPRHVLEDDFPLTPRGALRAATRLPNDDQARPHLVAEAMKEYGISTLVMESAAENKSDYINRWLLHRLRISPLEVELLYAIFSATLKVNNIRRWQEDVLYYWSRDKANKPKEEYDGLVTTRDALVIEDDLASENLNSALGRPDRPGSDPGDILKHRGHQKPRSLQSVS